MSDQVTLLVSCRDRTGIVAAVSDLVARSNGNILDADQHSEADSGMFFMRMRWQFDSSTLTIAGIERALDELAERFELVYKLHVHDQPLRIALWCSTAQHCIYDILLRHRMGEFPGAQMACVMSNHDQWQDVCDHFDVPFYHIPVLPNRKEEAEQRQREVLAREGVELIVLARYMQILSPALVTDWQGRIINIHHSFLPAFVGAKPYHQAKARGVKIIGATAHYVTAELDQGPIIEQDVSRVTHRDEVPDLVRKGRDLERQVLSRAVSLHNDYRILVSGNRTIIFR